MVKLPQRTIGYCVDGVTSFVPEGGTASNTSARSKTKTSKEPARNLHWFQTSLAPSVVEEIKAQVKKGELDRALAAACSAVDFSPYCRLAPRKNNGDRFVAYNRLMLTLFAPNIEMRTPAYFASLTGQTDIVKVLLSLLIMLAPKDFRKKDEKDRDFFSFRFSLETWLGNFGYPMASFQASDLDVCVLNALNEETRAEIRSTTYSLPEVLSIATSAAEESGRRCPRLLELVCWRADEIRAWRTNEVNERTNALHKKQPKPQLNFGTWESDYLEASSEAENDGAFVSEKEYEAEADDSSVSSQKDGNLSARDALQSFSEDDIATAIALSLSAAHAPTPLAETADKQSPKQSPNPPSAETCKGSVAEDASFCFSVDSCVDRSLSEDSGWDVVSSAASVVSFDSIAPEKAHDESRLSYREALVRSLADADTTTSSPKSVVSPIVPTSEAKPSLRTIREREASLMEEEDDAEFDLLSVVDGVKGARGGRASAKGKSRRGDPKIHGCCCPRCRLQRPLPGAKTKLFQYKYC